MNASYEKELAIANNLCGKSNSTLVFLTIFGSSLYGTSTKKSDLDIRGLFLPSIESLILESSKRSIHYSTANDDAKNSEYDVDMDLWSLSRWLLHLLPDGDTGALDLLFSSSNKDCIIFKSPLMDEIFDNSRKLLNLANNQSYIGYSLGQAKKYGIKGTRLGALRAVSKWLNANNPEGYLRDYIDSIALACNNDKFCFSRAAPNGQELVLNGKIHSASISMKEFQSRIKRQMEMYGERAIAAEQNMGLDFKALSHAMRAMDQMEELLLSGRINYPLKGREHLIKIKKGEIPWPELETMIIERLAKVNKLHEELSKKYVYDYQFAQKILLKFYGIHKEDNE